MENNKRVEGNGKITIAILAGGASRRMGSDKALLKVGGIPMLERVLYAAIPTGLRVVVVGRTGSNRMLPGVKRWIADETPGAGPLAALHTSMATECCDILALGCDMPLLDQSALAWLIQESERSDAFGGIAALHAEIIEPLFAVYRYHALAVFEALLRTGVRSLWELIESVDFDLVEPPPEIANKLISVNTPEDLERVRGLL